MFSKYNTFSIEVVTFEKTFYVGSCNSGFLSLLLIKMFGGYYDWKLSLEATGSKCTLMLLYSQLWHKVIL